jgi:hypothetical protein
MIEEQENPNEEHDNRSFTDKSLNKVVAILFVLAIYLVIFLKILFID